MLLVTFRARLSVSGAAPAQTRCLSQSCAYDNAVARAIEDGAEVTLTFFEIVFVIRFTIFLLSLSFTATGAVPASTKIAGSLTQSRRSNRSFIES